MVRERVDSLAARSTLSWCGRPIWPGIQMKVTDDWIDELVWRKMWIHCGKNSVLSRSPLAICRGEGHLKFFQVPIREHIRRELEIFLNSTSYMQGEEISRFFQVGSYIEEQYEGNMQKTLVGRFAPTRTKWSVDYCILKSLVGAFTDDQKIHEPHLISECIYWDYLNACDSKKFIVLIPINSISKYRIHDG